MPATPNFTLLKAARLIDTAREAVQEQAAILLEGDTVRQVGTSETVHAPEGAPVHEIDYGDATILPGLVDSHVHLNGIGDGRAGDELATLPDEVLTVQAAENARRHLYSGVTTLRDCGAKNRTTFLLREAVEMGYRPRAAPHTRRQARRHHRRSSQLLRHHRHRHRRVPRSRPPAHQGGRGLHQDNSHRRQHPHQPPAQALLQRRRAERHLRGSPPLRQARRRPLRLVSGHGQLPRRRH